MDTKAADMLYETIKAFFKKKTSSYDSVATVIRIEGNTAWVRIPGGVPETPVKLTVSARPGDLVQIRVGGGKAWITGNASAPPTDDTVAKEAAKGVGIIRKSVKAVGDAVDKVGRIAGNTAQYFWHTETGEDTGVHITEVPKDDFIQDPEHGGGNLLARSNGIAIRDGLKEIAKFFKDGIDFVNENAVSIFRVGKKASSDNYHLQWFPYDGEDTSLSLELAWTITEVYTVEGYTNNSREVIMYPEQNLYSFDGNVLTINSDGCAELYDGECDEICVSYVAEGYMPFFSLGTSRNLDNFGTYAFACGENNTASGDTSASFGESNESAGTNSFVANRENSAKVMDSAAFGHGNVVTKRNGFACGQYSDPAKNAMFVVGTGNSEAQPHNGFYVDDIGNVFSQGSVVAMHEQNNGNGYVCYNRKSIQRGFSDVQVPAQSYVDVEFTFSPAFANTPIVVAGLHSSSGSYAIGQITVATFDESSTGFTARVFNAGSSGRAPSIRWIAIE